MRLKDFTAKQQALLKTKQNTQSHKTKKKDQNTLNKSAKPPKGKTKKTVKTNTQNTHIQKTVKTNTKHQNTKTTHTQNTKTLRKPLCRPRHTIHQLLRGETFHVLLMDLAMGIQHGGGASVSSAKTRVDFVCLLRLVVWYKCNCFLLFVFFDVWWCLMLLIGLFVSCVLVLMFIGCFWYGFGDCWSLLVVFDMILVAIFLVSFGSAFTCSMYGVLKQIL